MERILVVDDDMDLCELLEEFLSMEGYQVECAHDGESGLKQAREGAYDLIILDVMLPQRNGFEVLSLLRTQIATPVVMLTARGDDVDRIVGLEMGADDYLPKPFNPRELTARIRAILRRGRQGSEETPGGINGPRTLHVGDVAMDLTMHTVACAGVLVDLTAVEFSFLELLLKRAGQVVSREELTRTVLGRELSPFDRSVDVHLSKLRKKLGHEIAGMERIKTIRGAGYLYALTEALGK